MEIEEAQEAMARLLGRCMAAEKALQMLIGSPQPNVSLSQLLKTNLTMRRQSLAADVSSLGIPAKFLPVAISAFVAQERSIDRGVSGGRYLP